MRNTNARPRALCTSDCTTDCGPCKGAGPMPRPDLDDIRRRIERYAEDILGMSHRKGGQLGLHVARFLDDVDVYIQAVEAQRAELLPYAVMATRLLELDSNHEYHPAISCRDDQGEVGYYNACVRLEKASSKLVDRIEAGEFGEVTA
jgi:hypothetical protein